MVSTVAVPANSHHFAAGDQFQHPRGSPTTDGFDIDENSETPAKIWIKSFESSGLLSSQAGASPCDNDAKGDNRTRFNTAPDIPPSNHCAEMADEKVRASKSLETLQRRRLVSSRATQAGDASWRLQDNEELLRHASSSSSDEASDEGSDNGVMFMNIFTMGHSSSSARKGRGSADAGDRSSLWQQYDLLEAMNNIRKSMATALQGPITIDMAEGDESDKSSDGPPDWAPDEDEERIAREDPISEDEDTCPPLPEFRGPSEDVVADTPNSEGQEGELARVRSDGATRDVSTFVARQVLACQAFMCCRAKPPKGIVIPNA